MTNTEVSIPEMIEEVNTYGKKLTPWEKDFMSSVTNQWGLNQRLTHKQINKLKWIYNEKV